MTARQLGRIEALLTTARDTVFHAELESGNARLGQALREISTRLTEIRNQVRTMQAEDA